MEVSYAHGSKCANLSLPSAAMTIIETGAQRRPVHCKSFAFRHRQLSFVNMWHQPGGRGLSRTGFGRSSPLACPVHGKVEREDVVIFDSSLAEQQEQADADPLGRMVSGAVPKASTAACPPRGRIGRP